MRPQPMIVVRTRVARLAAVVSVVALGVLGLSIPSVAQAANPPGPSGPYTVSGKITFPASAPSAIRQALDSSEGGYERGGVYLSVAQRTGGGTVYGWWLGENANVAYNPATGDWAVSGVGNADYRLTVNVILPGNGTAQGSGFSQEFTVNGGNVTGLSSTVFERASLSPVLVVCSSAIHASAIYATNVSTGQKYPVASRQSGWVAPHPRCSGNANHGNYALLDAPPGDYTLSFEQDGITEWYDGDEVGTLSESRAAVVTAQAWEGSHPHYMYGLAKPIVSAVPTLAATPTVGATLSADNGRWTTGTTKRYQWKRNDQAIPGATKSTYRLTSADRHAKVAVTVTGTKAGWWPAQRTSASKTVYAKLSSAKPKIRGTERIGKTLKVSRGSWTSGTKFTYRWFRNGTAISGATKASYTLRSSDAGKRFTVQVTGKKPGYATVSKLSAQTAKVARR